ncbi:MAG: hypothetical protein IMZ53_12980 [Thermoplasmata archaeon]|nr:hypothetical protein [Thermoplasmata archaeon]
MAKDTHRYSVIEALNINLGACGWKVITDTSVNTGVFIRIIFLADTIFTTLTDENGTGSIAGLTFAAGREIVGRFTTITLASGSVWALKGE